jgi:carboxymethylenebutenolidase
MLRAMSCLACASARTAAVDHVIENYPGTRHGWCVRDHSVYDEKGAERHWKRLTGFFAETLGG